MTIRILEPALVAKAEKLSSAIVAYWLKTTKRDLPKLFGELLTFGYAVKYGHNEYSKVGKEYEDKSEYERQIKQLTKDIIESSRSVFESTTSLTDVNDLIYEIIETETYSSINEVLYNTKGFTGIHPALFDRACLEIFKLCEFEFCDFYMSPEKYADSIKHLWLDAEDADSSSAVYEMAEASICHCMVNDETESKEWLRKAAPYHETVCGTKDNIAKFEIELDNIATLIFGKLRAEWDTVELNVEQGDNLVQYYGEQYIQNELFAARMKKAIAHTLNEHSYVDDLFMGDNDPTEYVVQTWRSDMVDQFSL